MKTLRIGIASADAFKARTMAIARGEYLPSANEPKVWFASIESAAKILSENNRALLGIIANEKPNSMQELALKTGRAKSNLSRTLQTMARYGLVSLEKGEGRNIKPRAIYNNIRLDLALNGNALAA